MATGEDIVVRLYRQAASERPLLSVSFDAFSAHCERLLGPIPVVASEYGSDLYLCCACAGRDRDAMAIIEREFGPIARSAVIRVNRDPEFVHETLQMLWDLLLGGSRPKIATYSGKGPLSSWLRVVATRVALDRCRALRANIAREVELIDQLADEADDPEGQLLRRRYAEAFQDALRNALSELPSRDRTLLRLHLEERCGIDEIARMHGVHRATAARWLCRARARVFDAARAWLAMPPNRMTDSEFRSVARAVGDELELSLSRSGDEARIRTELCLRSS